MISNLKMLSIRNQPSPKIIDLLKKSTWGTPNKSMRYIHCDVSDRVHNIEKPHFIQLNKGTRLIGLGCFCQYSLSVAEKEVNSFYIRYFSFEEAYQIEKVSSGKRNNKKSIVKEELQSILSEEGLANQEPALFYAYVDPDNERSLNLCDSFGFKTVRSYTTCLFSRMKPQIQSNASKASQKDYDKVRQALAVCYREYNMFSFRNLFQDGNYFVLRNKDGEITAGAHASPVHWHIKDMPGLSGKFIMNVVPKLPILNKLFNPDYKFVALDGLFVKEGSESVLEVLLEHILAHYKLNSALLWADLDSPIYQKFKQIPKGIMNAFYSENNVLVIAKSVGLSKEEETSLCSRPSYISSFDMT